MGIPIKVAWECKSLLVQRKAIKYEEMGLSEVDFSHTVYNSSPSVIDVLKID